MNNSAKGSLVSTRNPTQVAELAAWLAILATGATISLLVSLHALSPEFSPSWRMISEYAFGHYAWVLSFMFLSWGIGSWALVVAIWSQVHTKAGKVGLWFLMIAGAGDVMASVFDITHPIGHGIAGLLGVIGFPIAALLLSVALGHNQTWSTARRPLLWIGNLSWISVALHNGMMFGFRTESRFTFDRIPQPGDQNINFSANCIERGPPIW